jgi:hypothetical protein
LNWEIELQQQLKVIDEFEKGETLLLESCEALLHEGER